jgi:putative flavoprotein involved in K+ transport
MQSETQVVVIGGGQAGLSASRLLTYRGIDHVVLERDRIGSDWVNRRWDTFCLVTPNFQCRLPGYPYGAGGFGGTDPDGFMLRPQIVDYLRSYARSFDAPVYERVTVTAVEPGDRGGYVAETSDGPIRASAVVVATGGYHVPVLPPMSSVLGPDIVQVHSSAYRNPEMLPAGATLVVGTGQSGAQIAEDLHLAGRQVRLAIGSAPRVARRYRGTDCMTWLERMGVYDEPVGTGPGAAQARDKTNHYVTGRDGGHDIDLRRFAAEGMALHGRLLDLTAVDGGVSARFGDNLARDLDHADSVSESIKDNIDVWIAAHGIDVPLEERYSPVWEPAAAAEQQVDLAEAGITSVVWAVGYRKDYGWIRVPAFDERGYPDHERGVSGVPGLYFLGLPWLHTWGSGRFAAVGRDAEHVVAHLADTLARSAAVPA